MGGKAFLSHLPDATFPRLSPLVYAALNPGEGGPRRHRLIVACPHAAVGHEELKRETSEVYVQVDVNIRKDEKDWENVMIFHSYGDLGMIMGRLAASVGLHWGSLGLKMTSQALVPTYSPYFLLSSSIVDIFPFFGLSMERWKAGFGSQQEAFEWVTSSRFYVSGRISDRTSRAKSLANRGIQPQETGETEDREAIKESVRGEALAFFGKREEHDALVQANEKRVRLKAIWNGRKVGEWIGGNRGREDRPNDGRRAEQHVLQANETVELQIEEERQAREDAGEDVNET
ncbi:hypothetical protein BJV77DRAFT_1148089 [Russula vinacea]|nr:hypothetical protein BJV77DRAFT_1148089 [Russula vinacea]